MAAGRLDVLMGLDAAEFTKGLTKAEYEAKQFQDRVKSSLDGVGTAFKTILGAVTVREIVNGFTAIVQSLDDLDEAAQAIGTTAVALSEFRRSASDSGVSAEKFDIALSKMSVNLTDAAAGGKQNIETFKALGISLKNSSGQLLTTDELLAQVADKFAGFRDGAEKTALAVTLFGKAGYAMIPFLNQGAEGLRKFSGVTNESVEAAKKLQAQFDAIKAGLSALGIEIASIIIPALSKMIEEFNAARDAGGGFFGGLKLLAKQSAETLADPGKKIGELSDKLKELEAAAEGNQGLFGNVDNAEQIQSLKLELRFLKEIQRNRALANAPGANYRQEGFSSLPSAPIPDKANDLAKKQLETFLKEMEASVNYEKELASDRNKFLESAYREGLISIKDYFDARRTVVQQAADETVKDYDRMIAAEKKFQTSGAKTPEEVEASQGKVVDLMAKRAKATREAGAATYELNIAERQAGDAFARQLQDINAQVLELTGHLEEAAKIRFDAQFKTMRNQLANDPAGTAQLDHLEKLKVAQGAFDDARSKGQQITDELQNSEARLAVSRQAGAVTELGQLQLLGESRRRYVARMEEVVQAQERIAATSDNPKLKQQAIEARIALEQLAATADPLADKFNAIFEESFGDNFADFITGAKTAKEAFNDFAKSVLNQIAKIAAQDTAQALFGKGGTTGGGIGTFLAGLFGGSGGTFGSGTSTGGGGMTYVPSWDGSAYAMGTDFVPNDGLAMIHRGEAIIPAAENKTGAGKGLTVSINQSFAPGTSRETVNQAAAAAAQQITRSSRRNN